MDDLFAKPEVKKKTKLRLKKKSVLKKVISKKEESVSDDSNKSLFEFIQLLSKGLSRVEIIDQLGLRTNQFESLISAFYTTAEDEIESKSPLKLYVEIVSRKNKLFRDLEKYKDHQEKAINGKSFRNGQAYVGAIKAQDMILDSMVATGQNLGLVQKAAERVHLIGDQDIRDMNSDTLEAEIIRSINETQRFLSKKGASQTPEKGNIISFPANTRTV